MFATQRDVRLVIREPDTPGGFKFSMAWRPASKSATAEAIMSRRATSDQWKKKTLRRDRQSPKTLILGYS